MGPFVSQHSEKSIPEEQVIAAYFQKAFRSRNSSILLSLSSFFYDPHRKNSSHVLLRFFQNIIAVVMLIVIIKIKTAII